MSEPELLPELPEGPDDVLIVPPDVDLQQLKSYVDGGGPLPDRAYLEPFEVWTARGRVADCDCQLLQCVCEKARAHKVSCALRFSMTCAIPIECEPHGFDVCPTCDPCTCEGPDQP